MTNLKSWVIDMLEPSNADRETIENFVTVLGYILSSMAISIHVFVHFTTDIFRNFPGNLLLSNCILLLLQYCSSMCFLILRGDNFSATFGKDSLRRYDYYVTAYIWSVLTRVQFAMALDLWKCLRSQTTNARLSKGHTSKFVKYTICCWLSPFLEWGLLWFVYHYVMEYFHDCPILCSGDLYASVFMTYYVSDFALMILNFSFYIICVFYIYLTRSSVKSANPQKSTFLFYFKICGRLFVMSEVNYTLLIFLNHFEYEILRLIFNNFMAFHGAVVFSTIVLKKSLLKYKNVKADTENTATTTN